MKFEDLEYIALEGGGGKGAVYKGAIVALETLFDEDWRQGKLLKMRGGELVGPRPSDALARPGGGGAVSILDYHERGTRATKIKGISGASAGAITAFPLALGLTSEDIALILESYPFKEEFLPNSRLDQGKYRMVGMDGHGAARILVAEDDLKKLGERRVEPYRYSSGEPAKIGGNWLKGVVRGFIVSEVLRIILTGLRDRLEWVRKGVGQIQANIENQSYGFTYPRNYIAQFLTLLDVMNEKQIALLSRLLTSLGKRLIGDQLKRIGFRPNRWKLFGLLPANNLLPAVANLMWDRGIYPAFEVRDFFYKILLMAISKDTHFRRGLVRSDIIEGLASRKEIERLRLKFNDRFEVEAGEASRGTLARLGALPERLTFRELNKIINLNLTICVTNATTSQPVYFSPYFTPDFPVLEALGASMSFPVAFKPLYNEANVLRSADDAHPDFVRFKHAGEDAGVYKEKFKMSDYHRHLGEVLSFVKARKGLEFSTNGNLSFRSFLPYLRRVIQEQEFDERLRRLCHFYYNSAFKGLLIDGGATNNLPASIFTFTTDADGLEVQRLEVKRHVLALKLDNSFPEDLKAQARDILEQDKLGRRLLKETDESKGLLREKLSQYAFAAMLFKKLRLKKAHARNAELSGMSREVWVKIGKELIDEYKLTAGGFTPWNRQVNVFAGLMSALQFGFDQGQIEEIADNANIIPLYCYGVGTLDFDLTAAEMEPLVKLAVAESERDVLEYFGKAPTRTDGPGGG